MFWNVKHVLKALQIRHYWQIPLKVKFQPSKFSINPHFTLDNPKSERNRNHFFEEKEEKNVYFHVDLISFRFYSTWFYHLETEREREKHCEIKYFHIKRSMRIHFFSKTHLCLAIQVFTSNYHEQATHSLIEPPRPNKRNSNFLSFCFNRKFHKSPYQVSVCLREIKCNPNK